MRLTQQHDAKFREDKDGTSRWGAPSTFDRRDWILWLCEEREGRQGAFPVSKMLQYLRLVARVPGKRMDKVQGGLLIRTERFTKGALGQ